MVKNWVLIFSLLFGGIGYAQTSGGGPFSHSPTLSFTYNGSSPCYPYQVQATTSSGSIYSCIGGVVTLPVGGSGGGSGTPGGSNTDVQFNNSGSFGGNGGFVYKSGNVGIGSSSPSVAFDVVGSANINFNGSGTFNVGDLQGINNRTYLTVDDVNSQVILNEISGFIVDGGATFLDGGLVSTNGSGDFASGGIVDNNISGGLVFIGDPNHTQDGTLLTIDTISNSFSMNSRLTITGDFDLFESSGITDTSGLLGNSGQFLGNTGSGVQWQNLPSSSGFWVTGNVGINTTSNVGIGSINPGQKLDVIGTIRATSFMGNGSALTGLPTSVSNSDSTLTISPTTGAVVASLNLTHANTWTGQQIFNTANVGVGSTSPGQKLDVVGTVRSTAFIKSGGTSSQFLKADGSVDSTSYSSISGLTTNFLTKATSATTVGNSLVFENGNVGINTTSPSEIFDVNGNIKLHSTPNRFIGLGDVNYLNWPGSSGGADQNAFVPDFTNQIGVTSYGGGDAFWWNGGIKNGVTMTVSGITVVPLIGAFYNGNCGMTVRGTNLSGSPGSISGTIITTSNCPPTVPGTITKGSGTGDATISVSAYTLTNWSSATNFLGGIVQIGDPSVPENNATTLNSLALSINQNPANWLQNGDHGFFINDHDFSPGSSGAGYFVSVNSPTDGTVINSVGFALQLVGSQIPYGDTSGYGAITMDISATRHPFGFAVIADGGGGPYAPSGAGLGNYAMQFNDYSINPPSFSVPQWVNNVHTPRNSLYTFTVSGVTVSPTGGQAQYTNNGGRFDIISTSIVAGSGTIVAEGSLTAPGASGTLTRLDTGVGAGGNAGYISVGDATISFSSVVKNAAYQAAFRVEPISGNVSIGTTAPANMLDVRGTINFNAFEITHAGNVGVNSVNPGQALDVQGTIRISALGSTLAIASGTNGCMGQATLSSGTVTVSTTCTPSTSLGIFLTDAQSSITNVGSVTIATVTSGSSFVVQSTNILDASKVNWFIEKTS